jgi:Mrp family chromosome partitioning ATPase
MYYGRYYKSELSLNRSGKLCAGIVLVLRIGATRRKLARVVVETVRASKLEVLGAVLNKSTFPIPERIYSKLKRW